MIALLGDMGEFACLGSVRPLLSLRVSCVIPCSILAQSWWLGSHCLAGEHEPVGDMLLLGIGREAPVSFVEVPVSTRTRHGQPPSVSRALPVPST